MFFFCQVGVIGFSHVQQEKVLKKIKRKKKKKKIEKHKIEGGKK